MGVEAPDPLPPVLGSADLLGPCPSGGAPEEEEEEEEEDLVCIVDLGEVVVEVWGGLEGCWVRIGRLEGS